MKTKITLTIILTIIIFSNIAIAVGENTLTPINPNINQPIISAQQIQDFYILEETKTRNEFTQYTNNKINEMINTIKVDGQRMIDENFRIFDERMHALAQEFLIKFIIGLMACIILANSIWYYIQKKIEGIGQKKAHLTPDEYAHIISGILTKEYKERIKDQAPIENKQYADQPTIPSPPSVEEIETMINNRKYAKQIEKQHKQQVKELKKARKLQEKNDKIKRELEQQQNKIKMQLQKIQPTQNTTNNADEITILPPNKPNTMRTQ